MGIFCRMITFLALTILIPAMACDAQKVGHAQIKKPLLPANTYTLADKERKIQKAKPIILFYRQSSTLSLRSGAPAYTGMQTLGWGWFCHTEHRFRQTTKVPLFVRLGSVEQTNRLEGK